MSKVAPAKAKEERVEIVIPPIEIHRMKIQLVGDSPLIVHRWSEKAKKQILEKQMKIAQPGKTAKDPEQDFQDSLYIHPEGGFGFPAIAFKAAAVSACRFSDGTKMTFARGAFHIEGELVKIEGDEPIMREDMVRVGMGTADIRYRGEFKNWSVTIPVSFNKHALSEAQIINLFNLAGFGVGVGEWRPEKDGSNGRFHVAVNGDSAENNGNSGLKSRKSRKF